MNAVLLFPLLKDTVRHITNLKSLGINQSEPGGAKPEVTRSPLPAGAGERLRRENVQAERGNYLKIA